jgi:hypothetical protein
MRRKGLRFDLGRIGRRRRRKRITPLLFELVHEPDLHAALDRPLQDVASVPFDRLADTDVVDRDV